MQESTLGARIQARRHELSLTQDQLAAKTGLSKTFLSDLERDKYKSVGVGSLAKVAAGLAVDVSALIRDGATACAAPLTYVNVAIHGTELVAAVRRVIVENPLFDHAQWTLADAGTLLAAARRITEGHAVARETAAVSVPCAGARDRVD